MSGDDGGLVIRDATIGLLFSKRGEGWEKIDHGSSDARFTNNNPIPVLAVQQP